RLGLTRGSFFEREQTVLHKIAAMRQGLEFEVVVGPSGQIHQALRDRELDAAFVEGDWPGAEDLSFTFLDNCELVIAAPSLWEADLLAGGWAFVASKPWIFASPNCSYYKALQSSAAQAGFTPKQRFLVEEEVISTQLVRSGMALSVLPRDLIES